MPCCDQGKIPRVREMTTYLHDGYAAFRQPKFECGCCEMLVFRVCDMRNDLYVFSLYRNPDLDDRIFDCLLPSELCALVNKTSGASASDLKY